MLEILASAASEAAPAAPKGITMAAEDWVILGAYILASLFFAVMAIRRGVRRREEAPALPMSAEDAALDVPDREVPPTAELSSSLPPAAPPPLPPGVADGTYIAPPPESVALPEDSQGIFRYFRVKTAIYRKIDLLFIGLVVLIFAGLTTGGAGGQEVPVSEKFKPEVLVVSIFFQVMLMGMACAFVVTRIHQAEWLGLRWRRWWLSIPIALCSVFCMWCFMGFLAVSGWNSFLEELFHIESMQESVKLLKEAKDPMVIVLMSVAAVVVAPVAEEVVFRGYLYPAAKHFCGPVPAIIFSSLVFSAAHANVVALLPLFILATLLCLAYEFTGSIWANISIHFLFNAATVTLQLLVRYGIIPNS
ncbi:CPBP family intramembrane glutamic endopeptidase [Haloferula sp. BvORR071]|uniref:CPBP family intramembrane glutamic endopeptidase n=1 Tax=Haloferula sp. BvORR071 TaxID=1396141 RepID=UPI0005532957|nr:CPBP family intramembrane glutamic endopeptidase [Haloferula sp. BvORR071]